MRVGEPERSGKWYLLPWRFLKSQSSPPTAACPMEVISKLLGACNAHFDHTCFHESQAKTERSNAHLTYVIDVHLEPCRPVMEPTA